MKSKKAIEKLGAIILALTLILIFAIFAIGLSTGMAQKFTETFNVKVISKLDGIKALPIPDFFKSRLARERGLEAKITISPGGTVCKYEELEISALSSILPENMTFADVTCSWDMDSRADTNCAVRNVTGCGNLIGNDDEDISDCFARASMSGDTSIRLTLVTSAGIKDTADAAIDTENLCACYAAPEIAPRSCDKIINPGTNLVSNGVKTAISVPKYSGQSTIVRGVHIKVNAEQPVEKLEIYIANKLAYKNTKGNITGDFIVEGQNLTSLANAVISTCTQDECPVLMQWYIDANKILNIKEIDVPYRAF